MGSRKIKIEYNDSGLLITVDGVATTYNLFTIDIDLVVARSGSGAKDGYLRIKSNGEKIIDIDSDDIIESTTGIRNIFDLRRSLYSKLLKEPKYTGLVSHIEWLTNKMVDMENRTSQLEQTVQ